MVTRWRGASPRDASLRLAFPKSVCAVNLADQVVGLRPIGGGHALAAGFTALGTLDEVQARVLAILHDLVDDD